MATLKRDAMEYFWWELDGLPPDVGAVEALISGGWRPLHEHDGTWRILLAGPDRPDPLPAGAVRVVERWQNIRIRITHTPETIVVSAGSIILQA